MRRCSRIGRQHVLVGFLNFCGVEGSLLIHVGFQVFLGRSEGTMDPPVRYRLLKLLD